LASRVEGIVLAARAVLRHKSMAVTLAKYDKANVAAGEVGLKLLEAAKVTSANIDH
jgi:hypothetical protein